AEAEVREAIFLFRSGEWVEARQAHLVVQCFGAQGLASGAPMGPLTLGLSALGVAEPDAMPLVHEFIPSHREEDRPNVRLCSGYVVLGDALRAQKKFQEAELYLRKAVRLQPDSAEAHRLLGGVLREQKKFKDAEAVFREAVRLRPNDAAGHRRLADV